MRIDLNSPVSAASIEEIESTTPTLSQEVHIPRENEPWVDSLTRSYQSLPIPNKPPQKKQKIKKYSKLRSLFYLPCHIQEIKVEDLIQWPPERIQSLHHRIASYFKAEILEKMSQEQISAFHPNTMKRWDRVQLLSALPKIIPENLPNILHRHNATALRQIHKALSVAQKRFLYTPFLKATTVAALMREIKNATKGHLCITVTNLWKKNQQACAILFYTVSTRLKRTLLKFMTSEQIAFGIEHLDPLLAYALMGKLCHERQREVLHFLPEGPVRNLCLQRKYLSESISRLEVEIMINELRQELLNQNQSSSEAVSK